MIKVCLNPVLSLLVLLLIASCQSPQYADIVFRGGAVVTMDDERAYGSIVTLE